MADKRPFIFGPGIAWMDVIQYPDGSAPAVPAPYRLQVQQDISIDFDETIEELYGQLIYPTAVGVGKAKVTGKIKDAMITSHDLELFVGNGAAGVPVLPTGNNIMVLGPNGAGEPATVPAATPFTYTVLNAPTFVRDWGVRYAATGLPLVRVATVTAAGQYSVAAGVYTFDTADASAPVLIDYEYTTTGGYTVTYNSQLQGQITLCELRFAGFYAGQQFGAYIPQLVVNKFSLQTKMAGFTIPELDFTAYATPANEVAMFYVAA
jgi:hypothetical protein